MLGHGFLGVAVVEQVAQHARVQRVFLGLHQGHQQRFFSVGEPQFLFRLWPLQGPVAQVHDPFLAGVGGGVQTPAQAFEHQHQFVRGHRLGHVDVGTAFVVARDAVVQCHPGGHHHDTGFGQAGAQAPTQAQAAFARQVPVDDEQVNRRLSHHIVKAGRAVGGVNDEAVVFQVQLDFFAQQLVVFDQGHYQWSAGSGVRCEGVRLQKGTFNVKKTRPWAWR